MAELRVSVDVAASTAATWTALTDWDRQSAWMLLTTVRGTYRDGQGVGGRLEAFTGLGPVGFLDPMEVTHWDPPHRCLVRHAGRVVRGAGAFEVLERPGGCRIVWTEWLELPLGLAGHIGFAVARPLLAVPLRLSLRRLARTLEAQQRAG